MKVAVTGITGFIGKNLFHKIVDDDNKYLCLVRETSKTAGLGKAENIEFRVVNFEHANLTVQLKGIDVVIHMIGQMGGYGVPAEDYMRINCNLTKNMIDACKDAKVKQFIYFSTPGVQGFGKRLCCEEEPYAPRNLYERTKAEAEKIIIQNLSGTGVNYTIIRPDFVYGPGDVRRIKMYRNIRSHRFVLTTSGKSYLHPTYVMDVVQGVIKTIGNPCAYNEIFNLSAERDISVKEYLDTIAEYFGTKIIHVNIGYYASIYLAGAVDKLYKVLLKREGFVSKNKIDFLSLDHSTSHEKASKLLGYHPQYSFKEGLAETMKWCKTKKLI